MRELAADGFAVAEAGNAHLEALRAAAASRPTRESRQGCARTEAAIDRAKAHQRDRFDDLVAFDERLAARFRRDDTSTPAGEPR
jgi:hypothetical protein